ncbi:MAG: endonuclease [Bacteroidales bacterium]|nr:endonuclease [Bacteroidales bacterium]
MKLTRLLTSILLFLLVGMGSTVDAVGKKSSKSLRILVWNIQNGMWDGQPDNYNRFVEWVNEVSPDICIFCEASTIYYTGTDKVMPKGKRYLPDHWGELAARFGHEHWFKGMQRDNYPQVVTSRFPIDSIAVFAGNADTVVVHGSGWAQVRVPGVAKPINVVPMHTKPKNYAFGIPKEMREESSARYDGAYHRRNEIKYVCEHTILKSEDPDSEYWIFAGDFNAPSRLDNWHLKKSETLQLFVPHDYIHSETPYIDVVAECFPGMFFPSHGKSRIDFVYMNRNLFKGVKNVYAEPDEYTRRVASGIGKFFRPSDHYPVIVDINLKKLK